jgi:hypothetical protein
VSVYFITAREVGMVKIGCAYEPHRRMTFMQTACPVGLALEAILPGAYAEEKRHHEMFAEHRVRGEWFKITPEIEALIAANQAPDKPRSIAQRRRILAMHDAEAPLNRKLSEQERKYADAMAEMRGVA